MGMLWEAHTAGVRSGLNCLSLSSCLTAFHYLTREKYLRFRFEQRYKVRLCKMWVEEERTRAVRPAVDGTDAWTTDNGADSRVEQLN